jgi:hypothetical protein
MIKKKKLISILMAMTMILSTIMLVPVTASPNEEINALSDEAISEWSDEITSDFEGKFIPDFLDIDEAVAKTHIGRLAEYEETADAIGYKNTDGTNTVYSYLSPIRFENDNGEMVFFDQTLISKKQMVDGKTYQYQNKASDVKVYFNEQIDSTKGILTVKDDVKVEMGIVSESKAQNAKIGSDNNIVYEEAFGKGTRASYTPTDFGFKEDIILDSYTGINNFKFWINTYGLIPEKTETGAVLLLDKESKEVKGTISSIFAYDATEKNITYDNTLEIKESGNHVYILSYTINEKFLTASDTVYPVVIDPSVDLGVVTNGTYVSRASPNTNYQSESSIRVSFSGGVEQMRGYYKIDISSFESISASAITSAYLNVSELTMNSGTSWIYVHRITQDWLTGNLTWNNRPSQAGTSSSFNANGTNSGKYSCSITDIVRYWKNNPGSNYGISLTAISNFTPFDSRVFAKNNYTGASYRPYITINFNRTKIYPARIITDWAGINSTADTAYNDMVGAFKSTFGIEFQKTAATTVPQNNSLNGYCPNSDVTKTCKYASLSTGCGTTCKDEHHKNTTRLLRLGRSILLPNEFVIRVVHYRICSVGAHDGEGSTIYGSAWYPGYDSVVSSVDRTNKDIASTMQHELSHNLGASGHSTCFPNEPCTVADYGTFYRAKDKWCRNCSESIMENN